MQKKNKLILLDFDEIQLLAIKEWLLKLGDIDAISDNSDLNSFDLMAKANNFDLIIQSIGNNEYELKDEDIIAPLLIIETKNNISKNKHKEIIKSPFRFEQFEMKIRNILRTKELQKLESLVIHGYKYINSKRALVLSGKEEIKLTDKEIEILSYLHNNRHRSISREEMLREVWRYQNGVTTHTLETHIYRLRQKIAAHIGELEALITNEGGYKLVD